MTPDMAEKLEEEKRILGELSRCTDLFGRMLLTGKLKALHRAQIKGTDDE